MKQLLMILGLTAGVAVVYASAQMPLDPQAGLTGYLAAVGALSGAMLFLAGAAAFAPNVCRWVILIGGLGTLLFGSLLLVVPFLVLQFVFMAAYPVKRIARENKP